MEDASKLTRRLHHSSKGCKKSIGKVLEHRAVEAFVMLLVFVDIGLLVTESMLDMGWLCLGGRTIYGQAVLGSSDHGPVHLAEQIAEAPPIFLDGGTFFVVPSRYTTELRQLHGPTSDLVPAHSASAAPTLGHATASLLCQTKHGPKAVAIENFCHKAGIAILSIFFVEILIKIWIGCRHFFHNPFEVLDFVVVTLSLVVDALIVPILQNQAKAETELVVALLLLFRVWRVARILHGIVEVVKPVLDHEKELKKETRDAQKEIDIIKAEMRRLGIQQPSAGRIVQT